MVWQRFGRVKVYIEPFFGSGAVFINCPYDNQRAIINDLDGYVVNFWRAIKLEPDVVYEWSQWLASELDLVARQRWMMKNKDDFLGHMRNDPNYYDLKVAGWWAWGMSTWIGAGWCEEQVGDNRLPACGTGAGVHSQRCTIAFFRALAEKFKRTIILCGSWNRCVSHAITAHYPNSGIFLDPPYSPNECDPNTYRIKGNNDVAVECREWCLEHGTNRDLRIALCGYEGEHEMPDDWECLAWKSHGGMGAARARSSGRYTNNVRERIWFSPGCLTPGLALWD